ncbi:MAG: DUF2062 domain-containing protein [Gallionella sp.]|jgi:hypothetical protein
MRKFLHHHLPDHESVKNNRWLKPLGFWLHQPDLWHLHRHSVAGGVAAGLFCGLIPGPLQMISAALVAVFWRVNLPVALIVTLYTNPLTIVPLYLLAFKLGAWVSGAQTQPAIAQFDVQSMHWLEFSGELWDWLIRLGQPLLIGLPLLALIFAFSGYVLVRIFWRVVVIVKWRASRRRASNKNSALREPDC